LGRAAVSAGLPPTQPCSGLVNIYRPARDAAGLPATAAVRWYI